MLYRRRPSVHFLLLCFFVIFCFCFFFNFYVDLVAIKYDLFVCSSRRTGSDEFIYDRDLLLLLKKKTPIYIYLCVGTRKMYARTRVSLRTGGPLQSLIEFGRNNIKFRSR